MVRTGYCCAYTEIHVIDIYNNPSINQMKFIADNVSSLLSDSTDFCQCCAKFRSHSQNGFKPAAVLNFVGGLRPVSL